MSKRLVALGLVVASIAAPIAAPALAASGPPPSQAQLVALFAPSLAQPGCISSVMFKRFPIAGATVKNNSRTLDAFVAAGLMAKSSGGYNLTPLGRGSYRLLYRGTQGGFCFAERYSIARVKRVDPMSNRLRPEIEAAWIVTADVAPTSVKPWATSPKIREAVGVNAGTLAAATRPTQYYLTVSRRGGSPQLVAALPSIKTTVGINMGF